MEACGTKLKILCLHGWRSSSKVTSFQSQGLVAAFGDRAEFVYLDAPYPALGPAHQDVRNLFGEGPYFEWFDSQTEDDRKIKYIGIEKSIQFLQDKIKTLGPFDVLLGFSQGSNLVTIMNILQQKTSTQIAPWKASVLVCGVPPRDECFEPQLEILQKARVPSIHILGESDQWAFLSEDLLLKYSPEQRKVYRHSEGHKFPSVALYQSMYRNIADDITKICLEEAKL